MVKIDFYKGFEGEPEVIFSRRDSNGRFTGLFHVWDGYFNDIMEQISPGPGGSWEGVALYYHTGIGWRDSTDWEILDVPLFLSQLNAIDPSNFRLGSGNVLRSLVEFLEPCLASNEQLFIKQD